MDATSQETHQPKYRKRENKPGQKEKRVMKRTGGSPSPHRRQSKDTGDNSKSRSSSKANAKPTNGNSKTNAKPTNGNSKTKSKKQNKSKKTKKSKLAFWFCMSANTDNIDQKSQVPVKKPKPKAQPKPTPKPVPIEVPPDTVAHVQDVTPAAPTEILATKHSRRKATKRYSAPSSSEWTTIMTRAIVESPSERPRSRTPTRGVRYRYDGTLERPYVYPGGLTFSGVDKSKRFDEDKWFDGRGDSSFCDSTLDNRSQPDYREHFDEFDVRSRLYLRYDYDPQRDRRYSVPGDFVDGSRPDNGQSQHFPRQEIGLNTPMPNTGNKDLEADSNVIYDTPYESDKDSDKHEVQEDASEKRNSYYSTPLQNSRCIYMWHSCEDLQHCEHIYHSKEGINRICDQECDKHGPSNCNENNHNSNTLEEDVVSASSVPVGSTTANDTINGKGRKMSLPAELSCDHFSVKTTETVSVTDDTATTDNNWTHRNGNHFDQKSINDFSEARLGRKVQKQTSLPIESTIEVDNPFKRNLGRSSCMPGNKRFFIPPPPCYTPPKEEMEAALPMMSRASRHCGSQTDLAEDLGGDDMVDMKDRDLSLKREQNQSHYATILQGSEVRLNIEMPSLVKSDKPEKENGQADLNLQSNPVSLSSSHPANDYLEPRNSVQNSHHTNNNSTDQLQRHTPTVITSTPKPARKNDSPSDGLAIHTYPKPIPRKRIRNKDSQSSSVSMAEPDPISPIKKDTVNDFEKSRSNIVASPPANKIPPVPKKRRSQLIEAELTYTAADIEKGLTSCNDDVDLLPSSSVHYAQIIKSTATTTTPFTITPINNEIVSRNQNPSQKDNKFQGNNINHTHIQETFAKSVILEKSPAVVNHGQVNTLPLIKHRLNSSRSSSVEGGSPSRDLAHYSPSVDHVIEGFRQMTYDSDNEDNCNADDEMSLHNEDLTMAKSASVQNLLRSRSIFDRSLAVTRKRRQRMRDRKCQSQLLSSADLDQYDVIHVPGNHLWKNSRGGSVDAHAHSGLTWASIPTERGKHFNLNGPLLWMEKSLWKHSYTDSGHDSDIMSPVDSRYSRPREYFQETGKAQKCGYHVAPLNKTPWDVRLRQKHELRKARSIEHLFLTQNSEVGNVKKPSLETCV